MKRFLRALLCAMLVMSMLLPCAFADTYTLDELFLQQFVVGGNGIAGSFTLTASGVADWLEYLQPFTAAKISIRAIGEPQGDMHDSVTVEDYEDWQLRFYAKDSAGVERGRTWIYGDSSAIYLQSELLPDVLLTWPRENAHILYGLARGQILPLMTALDPNGITANDRDENPTAYGFLASLSQISEEEWDENWAPVMDKYNSAMDLWLSGYGTQTVKGQGTGSLTMSATYSIPAADLKAQTKQLLGMMLYDYELQALLAPHFTQAEKTIYLNPTLVYFYNACIDALPLEGNILLSKQMSAMGDTIGMSVSLPLPPLPEELTAPVSHLLAQVFQLPYDNVLSGVNQVTFEQAGGDVSITLNGSERTISFILDESAENAESVIWDGFIRIVPSALSDDPSMFASFSYRSNINNYQDDNWVRHSVRTVSLELQPDLSLLEEDDPFRSRYVNFAPIGVNSVVDMYSASGEGQPVKMLIDLGLTLPDAQIALSANLRMSEKWAHETLPKTGALNAFELTDEDWTAFLDEMKEKAIDTMISLNTAAAPATTDPAPQEPAPTEVPPLT